MRAHTPIAGLPATRVPALVAMLAALLLAGSAVAAPAAADEHDEEAPAADRVDGDDRYATAAEIARATFADADTAIVASGADFPDALVASYGPMGIDAPVLLSRHTVLPDATVAALEDLGVQSVFMMGGEAALSEDVLDDLQDRGYNVFRAYGETRYETATSMLDGFDPPEIGTLGDDRTALLASGENFPDALAAGPIAAAADLPLLLTTPWHSDATEAAADAMEGTRHDIDIERVVIVGGPQAVDEDVEAYLRDERGFEVERWYGDNRSETATEIARNGVERLGFDVDPVLLARGDDFPDALAAGPHGAGENAPLLLAATPNDLDASAVEWLEQHRDDVSTVRALGGPSALSETVLERAVAAATPVLGQPVTTAPHEGGTAEVGTSQVFHLTNGADWPAMPNEMALFFASTMLRPCQRGTAPSEDTGFHHADRSHR